MAASTGWVLAVLQFAFALTWIVYVVYLPQLATQAGLAKEAVPWILLMDQAIFIACDWAAGVYADRVASTLSRIGPRLAVVTFGSCLAFVALPWVAPAGSVPLFLALTILWSASSSALRAPPLMLLGRHASVPQRPWLAGLYLFGVGAAGAAAPYLGSALKGIDPHIPFVVSSVAVAVVTFALARVELGMGGTPSTIREHEWRFREASFGAALAFGVAIALLAAGYQAHYSLNSAPAYLQYAKPADLEHLMPVFWIGFNLLMLPATWLAKRFGGFAVMTLAGIVGVLAIFATQRVGSLDALIAAQFVAGGAWGTILMGACTAAIALGHPGREGSVTGLLFSMLAVAAFARIGFVHVVAPANPELRLYLPHFPALAWAAGTFLVALLAAGPGRLSRSGGR
jgi:MFS family permease